MGMGGREGGGGGEEGGGGGGGEGGRGREGEGGEGGEGGGGRGRKRRGRIVIVFAGMTYIWDTLIATSLTTSDLVPSFLYLQFCIAMIMT